MLAIVGVHSLPVRPAELLSGTWPPCPAQGGGQAEVGMVNPSLSLLSQGAGHLLFVAPEELP